MAVSYIIVTYAREQMRGVQVRGIRIAQGLPKNEVLFLNSGDDSWLTKFGYKVKNVNLYQFFPGKSNLLPETTKCLIFPDLPTNHPGQLSILLESIRKKIPAVVVDNIYSAIQLKEPVYENTIKICDKMILLGLSYLKNKVSNEKITIVPPLLTKPKLTPDEARNKILKKFNFPADKKIVLGISYNEYALSVIHKLADTYKDVEFILLGGQTPPKQNLRFDSIASASEISNYILGSDLILCKMGYQQMIETWALGKLLITIGKERGLRKWWLDEKMREIAFDFKEFNRELELLFHKILFDEKYRGGLLEKVKFLHDGSFNGIETIAGEIKRTKFSAKKIEKILLLAIVDENTDKIRKIISSHPFILPILISFPFATKKAFRNIETAYKISDFEATGEENMIRSDFNLIAGLSPHSAHGLLKILPWYDDLANNFLKMANDAENVIVVGEKTKLYFQEIIKNIPSDRLELIK